MTAADASPCAIKAWRLLRDLGDWWTAGQLTGEMSERGLLTDDQGIADVRSGLDQLHTTDCVAMRSHAGKGSAWEYAVTTHCRAPAGESLTPSATKGSTP